MRVFGKKGVWRLIIILLCMAALGACSRVPKLPAPQNADVNPEGGALRVTWDAVDGADGYYVYRIKQGDESFRYWGVVREPQALDRTIGESALYAYKIFSATTDGKQYTRAETGTVTRYACSLAAPHITSLSMTERGCTVRWEALPLATEYELRRGDTPDGPFETVARTAQTEYTDTNAIAQKAYSYQVIAINEEGGVRTESPVTTSPQTLLAPAAPRALRENTKTALLHWEEQPGANSYTIYRASARTGPYTVAGTSDRLLFRDTSLDSGMNTVYYMVQSVHSADDIVSSSRPSNTFMTNASVAVTAIPVVMYHDFTTIEEVMGGLAFNEYAIYPDEFEQDLMFLKENGYTTIQLPELAAWLDGTGRLPEKPILLTIDDGTLGVYRYAYPLLKKYGMKAILSVIGERIDEGEKRADRMVYNQPFCSWEEIGEMGRSGTIEILPHGYYLHQYDTGITPGFSQRKGESSSAYLLRLSNDLLPLNEKIAQYTGTTPIGVTYPYSVWSDSGNDALLSLGYRFTLSGEKARATRFNYYINGLDVSMQDPMLARIVRLTGDPLADCLADAAASDAR